MKQLKLAEPQLATITSHSNERDSSTESLGAGFDFSDPNSPLAPFYLRSSHVVAIAFCALLFLYGNAVTLWHTDVWMHMKFGEWMWSHGHAPRTEPFSPWSDQSKLFPQLYNFTQTSLHLIYQTGKKLAGGNELHQMAGGVELLRFVAALLILARAVSLLVAFRRRSNSLPIAIGTAILSVAIAFGSTMVFRPQSIGLVCFAILLVFLSRSTLGKGSFLGVPILFVVWANAHGSFLAGFVFLGVMSIGKCIEVCQECNTWNPLRAFGDSNVRSLVLIGILSFLGCLLLNPNGVQLYSLALSVTKHSIVGQMIEWQPLASGSGGAIDWIFVGSLLLVLITHQLSPKGLTLTELLLFVVFFVGTCVQMRMINWYSMVMPWVVARHWGLIAEARNWNWPWDGIPSLKKTVLGVVLAFSVFMWTGMAGWLMSGQPRPLSASVSLGTAWKLTSQLQGMQEGEDIAYPELEQILSENYPEGRFQGTVLTSETMGDFLTWALPADVPTTMYSHVHLFDSKHWDANRRVLAGVPGWWDTLDRWNVNMIVIEPEIYPRLREALPEDKRWKIIADETGDPTKPSPFFRKMIAVRIRPR